MESSTQNQICPGCRTVVRQYAATCPGCGRILAIESAPEAAPAVVKAGPVSYGSLETAESKTTALGVSVYCLRCRSAISPSARFCPECGWDQSAIAVAPPVVLPIPTPLVQPQVILYPQQFVYPQQGASSSDIATAAGSLILGLLGLLAWLIPLLGVPITVLGAILGFTGLRSAAKPIAIAGIALSLLGLGLSVANGANHIYSRINHQQPLIHFGRSRLGDGSQGGGRFRRQFGSD